MSFGWSAGDIATAVKLIYDLIQALDSRDVAASDYREAVGFVRDLNRTLYPLQTFAAWRAYPSYAKDIEEQAAQIREPVESFLKAVAKFGLSLGQRHRQLIIAMSSRSCTGIFWYPRKGCSGELLRVLRRVE
jgi:hypothetical protein